MIITHVNYFLNLMFLYTLLVQPHFHVDFSIVLCFLLVRVAKERCQPVCYV